MKRLKVWVLSCVFLKTVMLINTLSRGKIQCIILCTVFSRMLKLSENVRCVKYGTFGEGSQIFYIV